MKQKKRITFAVGDWVSFDGGGAIISYICIGYVQKVHDKGLEVVVNGALTSISKDAILERRRG